MHSPFFSIIIPTFNSEKTLQSTLNSILEQVFTDLEIIIIDGMSGDATVALIEENFRKDRRIRYVSEADHGIYDAMNKGIDMAKGQWIYFLGSDDYLSGKNVLQVVNDSLKDCKCDFFYGQVLMKGVKYDGPLSLEKLLVKNISHQAIFYRRQIFEKNGKYNLRYKFHADWEFNIRYFLKVEEDVQYEDILIANFGAGGVSAEHDVLFLQEFLVPLKLQRLSRNPDSVKNIRRYDEWWRLLRNANIRRPEQLQPPGSGYIIPAVIQRMVKWQQLFSPALLRIGIVSKTSMFLSYLINIVTKEK